MWNVCAQKIEVRKTGWAHSKQLPSFCLDPNGTQIAKGDFELAFRIAAELLGSEDFAYAEIGCTRIYTRPQPKRGPAREVRVAISIVEV